MGKKKWVRQVVFPILAAMIWGTAFVFQSISAEVMGAFTFTALRSAVAVFALLGVLLIRRAIFRRMGKEEELSESVMSGKGSLKALLLGGGVCGVVLTIAINFQQFGLSDTSPGKAAFISALYIVLVPLAGMIFGKKVPLAVWGGVILASAGLYFLCIHEGELSITTGDLLVLLCAVCFAGHILVVDHFSAHLDGIELSCVQFAVVAVLSGIGMVLFEHPTWDAVVECLWPILYVGVFSSGVAYTLQILAQKGSNPAVVSVFLSLESVFATVATVAMLGEWLSFREGIGCILMLSAVMLAQLPEPRGKAARQESLTDK